MVGFSRSLAMYSKEIDIPHFMFGRNSTVKSFDKAEDAAAFYWQSSSKNNTMSYYKVFRSKTPNFKPSLRTFISNTAKHNFIDEPVLNVRGWQNNKLEPETTYYYKVQAIGKNNRAGKISSEIQVRIKNRNHK